MKKLFCKRRKEKAKKVKKRKEKERKKFINVLFWYCAEFGRLYRYTASPIKAIARVTALLWLFCFTSQGGDNE